MYSKAMSGTGLQSSTPQRLGQGHSKLEVVEETDRVTTGLARIKETAMALSCNPFFSELARSGVRTHVEMDRSRDPRPRLGSKAASFLNAIPTSRETDLRVSTVVGSIVEQWHRLLGCPEAFPQSRCFPDDMYH